MFLPDPFCSFVEQAGGEFPARFPLTSPLLAIFGHKSRIPTAAPADPGAAAIRSVQRWCRTAAHFATFPMLGRSDLLLIT
jgi:hypothetical protein